MASLVLSLLATPDAHAGTWQFTCTGSGTEGAQNWMPPGPSTGSYQISGYSHPTQPAQFSTTQAGTTESGGGTISAAVTLTWVPDAGQTATTDPPPASVLLDERSSASWTAQVDHYPDPYTTGGTSADDGLGDAEVATYYGGVKNGGTSCGSHYSAKTLSGGTLTLNRSFSAHATATTGASDAGVNFGFSFGSYALAVASPTIKISGTYDPTHGDYRVLTGQPIMVTLQGLSGYAVTKYPWAVGGSAFKTYDETAPSNQLVPLGSMDLTGPASGSTSVAALNFYDSKQENLTVTCTATVLAPDGTSLNITATSPKINVLKPTATWTVKSTAPFGPQFDSSATGFMSFAVQWDARVTVPSPFSGGSGCFAQIVNPTIDFQRHPSGNQPINCYLKVPKTNPDGTTTYVLPTTGLDTHFPYQASSTTLYSNGYTWDVSGAGQSGDQPGAGFATSASDDGGNNWYDAFDSGTFTTWLMYRPSSGGVWVPLQRVDWSWTGHVVKNAATGMWNSATNSSPPVTGSSSSPGIPVDTPPQWTTVNAGSNVLRP